MIKLAVVRAMKAWAISNTNLLYDILRKDDLSREDVHVLMSLGIPANQCVPKGDAVAHMIIALTGG